jgi:uncharacterized protein
MVVRETPWPEGTPSWADLATDNVDRAIDFYSALFGWKVTVDPNPEAGGYAMCSKRGLDVAGIGAKQDPNMPSMWTTYLAVDDVNACAEKIRTAGGQVLVEPFDVMDYGRMAIAVDPAGAAFGIWESGKHIGMKLANEPGAVTWNENLSRDVERNKAFYGEVFGYTFSDMSGGGFTYATFDLDGRAVGGIGELTEDTPAEVPAQWATYFHVEDTDAAVAAATKLGGTVVKPAFDTSVGRTAILTDDQNAAFAVINVR